jgi:hypothetical protein
MGLTPLAPLGGLEEGISDSLENVGSEIGPATSSILSGSSYPTTAPTTSATSSSSAAQSALGTLGSLGKSLGNATLSAGLSLFGINAQAVTIVVGLILIAGGIFLFKPVQQIVVKGARAAGKAAETAAIV